MAILQFLRNLYLRKTKGN